MRYLFRRSTRLVLACAAGISIPAFAEAPASFAGFEDPAALDVRGRTLTIEKGTAYLDAREGDGVAWLRDASFRDGRVSLEVRGSDLAGRSFVGIAFHASADKNRYDVVYVRPFNFQATDPQRRAHSLQYMAMPDHDWQLLRQRFPGKFEAAIVPAPAPEDWVRVTVEVREGQARIFIGSESSATLSVDLLNESGGDALGLWVGNNSEGEFRNLRIAPAPVN